MTAAGLNVVLVSWTTAKLNILADELSIIITYSLLFNTFINFRNTNGFLDNCTVTETINSAIEIKTAAFDFYRRSIHLLIYPELLKTELKGIQIGMLANYVEMTIGYGTRFDKIQKLAKYVPLLTATSCRWPWCVTSSPSKDPWHLNFWFIVVWSLIRFLGSSRFKVL